MQSGPSASIIIPAHDEARVITRLLDMLLADTRPGEFDVLVVCNGCTDDTARLARAHPGVSKVIDLAVSSKHAALLDGDAAARVFPRIYLDADVELGAADVRALTAAVSDGPVLAAAPQRDLRVSASTWPVRAYYDVWKRLPSVRDGLYGRGVLAVNEAGFARIADRPPVTGDDLYVHTRFAERERAVITAATSVVYGPRTTGDLIRRRARTAAGNAELGMIDRAHAAPTSVGSARALAELARERPGLLGRIAVFVAITVAARCWARVLRRRGGQATWLRDESSRDR